MSTHNIHFCGEIRKNIYLDIPYLKIYLGYLRFKTNLSQGKFSRRQNDDIFLIFPRK